MRKRIQPRFIFAVVAALVGSGIGILVVASEAGASGTLQVTPSSGLTNGATVTVSGTGFTASATGAVIECNNDPAQPTITVLGNAVPVSCSNPLSHIKSTSSGGALASFSFTVVSGTVGPPGTGTDSSGGSAATDAANYPCPPTAAQISAGDSCVIAYGDTSGDQATVDLSFSSGGGGGTTTTTSTTATSTTTTTTPSTTTTSSTTTTTTIPNAPADSPSYSVACSADGVPVNLPSVVTEGVFKTNPTTAGSVDNLAPNSKAVPNSLLSNVTLLNGPDTGLGLVIEFPTALEALTTPGATVTFSGTLPLTVTGGIGTPSLDLSGSFTVPSTYPSNAALVVAGTQIGTITAGQQKSMTVSQGQFTSASPLDLTVAIGTTSVPITCTSSAAETLDTATITGGNGASTPANPPSPGTVNGSSGADSGASSNSSAKPTTASELAFTGAGSGVRMLAIGGILLINLGFLVLTIYYRPRELFAIAGRRVQRVFANPRDE